MHNRGPLRRLPAARAPSGKWLLSWTTRLSLGGPVVAAKDADVSWAQGAVGVEAQASKELVSG